MPHLEQVIATLLLALFLYNKLKEDFLWHIQSLDLQMSK